MITQRFIDTRTGNIVTQVLISEICHFEEYGGRLQAGDCDASLAEALRNEEAASND